MDTAIHIEVEKVKMFDYNYICLNGHVTVDRTTRSTLDYGYYRSQPIIPLILVILLPLYTTYSL